MTVSSPIKKCSAFEFILPGRVKLSVIHGPLQRTTRSHFDPNVLESTEVSAVPAKMVHVKTSVQKSPVAVLDCGGSHGLVTQFEEGWVLCPFCGEHANLGDSVIFTLRMM